MSELGRRYTELMAPAFTGPLADADHLARTLDNGWERIAILQQAIREELGQVDWAGAELPERTLQPGEFFIERPLTADKLAERLMAFAFDDVLFIFGLAEGYVQEQAVDVPIGELLRNSRSNLLKIAALTDRDKDHLAIVIKHRINDEWKDIADAFGEPMFEGGAVRLIDDGDKPALDWHADIKDWIEARLYPESGCPALRFPVRINGKSTSLINYFWDCMTKLMYPEVTDSAGPAAETSQDS